MKTKTPTINFSSRFSVRLASVLLVLVALVISIQLPARASMAPSPMIITFDAPGAGTGAGQGTTAVSISTSGAIAGWYIDANDVAHGFLRARGGTITTFDAPGAGTGAGQGTFGLQASTRQERSRATTLMRAMWLMAFCALKTAHSRRSTLPARAQAQARVPSPGTSIRRGRSLGPTLTRTMCSTASSVLRAPSRRSRLPGAGTGRGQGTVTANVSGLNPSGAITGNYFDASGVFHGYVREADGTFTTFEAPGAGTGAGQGTLGASINRVGDRSRENIWTRAMRSTATCALGTAHSRRSRLPARARRRPGHSPREHQPIEHDHGTVS